MIDVDTAENAALRKWQAEARDAISELLGHVEYKSGLLDATAIGIDVNYGNRLRALAGKEGE